MCLKKRKVFILHFFYINPKFYSFVSGKWHRGLEKIGIWLVSFDTQSDKNAKTAEKVYIKDAVISLDNNFNVVFDRKCNESYFEWFAYCGDVNEPETIHCAEINKVTKVHNLQSKFEMWRTALERNTDLKFDSYLERVCFMFSLFTDKWKFNSGK